MRESQAKMAFQALAISQSAACFQPRTSLPDAAIRRRCEQGRKNFEKDGLLANELLGLLVEDLSQTIA